MINARRAALLGLDAPLTSIMVAVLGLWPETDVVEPVVVPEPFRGAPDAPASAPQRRDEEDPVAEFLKKQELELERISRQNDVAITMVLAAITEGMFA